MAKKITGRPSAVEISPHRKEIEEMLREGKSPDFISTWLKNLGVSISRSAIYRYKKDKFNIKAEAIRKYNDEKSQERLDGASDKKLDTVKYRDKLIKKGQETGFFDMSDKEIHEIALKAAKQNDDFFKDDPEPHEININLGQSEELNDLFKDKINELKSDENVGSEQ
jgi:hypothetical protein